MTEKMIYAFDPGDTTGWARLRYDDGYLYESGSVPFKEMCEFLFDRDEDLDNTIAIICEDWRLFGNKAKQMIGSDFKAIQVIGMLQMWLYRWHTPFVLQPANIKSIAEKFSGIKPTGTHDKSHHIDAMNHGIYWLKSQGHYQTELERRSCIPGLPRDHTEPCTDQFPCDGCLREFNLRPKDWS